MRPTHLRDPTSCRAHISTAHTQQPTECLTLDTHLGNEENRRWIVDNIRLGGLNELLLTCQSADAVRRDALLPLKQQCKIQGHLVIFNELQRWTSMPTHYFVFKGTHDIDIASEDKSQTAKITGYNSHPTGRLYYYDFEAKKHKTVGPASPAYHLAKGVRSLWSIFQNSGDVKTAVKRLYGFTENTSRPGKTSSQAGSMTTAGRSPASPRSAPPLTPPAPASQIYELRDGGILNLNDRIHLEWFAMIVHNHTCIVLEILRRLYWALEVNQGVESSSPPPSPAHDTSAPAATGGRFSPRHRPSLLRVPPHRPRRQPPLPTINTPRRLTRATSHSLAQAWAPNFTSTTDPSAPPLH